MKVGRFTFTNKDICATVNRCTWGTDFAAFFAREHGCTRRQALMALFKAQDKDLIARSVNMTQLRLTAKGLATLV